MLGFFKKQKRNFTEAFITAALSNAQGEVKNSLSTGALEICSGLWSRALSSATIEPEDVKSLFTPSVLAHIGRALIRKGEAICIKYNNKLLFASTASVKGDLNPLNWDYELTITGPTTSKIFKVKGYQVYHFKFSYDPSIPWVGVSPMNWASDTAKIMGSSEKRMSEEANSMTGYVVPVPEVSGEQTFEQLKKDIAGLKGGLALVESVSQGWGEGRFERTLGDWSVRRLGANPPDSLVKLRLEVIKTLVAACGVPPTLIFEGSAAQGNREAWRQFLHGSVSPVAGTIIEEINLKGNMSTAEIKFDKLFASDIQGRARAFQALTKGGMEISKAAAVSGMLIED